MRLRVCMITGLVTLFSLVTHARQIIPLPFGTTGKYVTMADDSLVNSWAIQFPIMSWDIVPLMGENQSTMDAISEKLLEQQIGDYYVLGVKIKGWASPDGPLDVNQELSYQRALAIKNYIQEKAGYEDDRFEIVGCGENWDELIDRLERDHSELGQKSLELIRETPQGEDPEVRLRKWKGGKCYQYLARYHFPALRSASTVQFVRLIPREEVVEVDTVVIVPEPDTVVIDTIVPKKFLIGVRTNVADWAVLVPSIGVEVYFAKRYALMCNYTYRWWQGVFNGGGKNHTTSSISGELRRFYKGDSRYLGWYTGGYVRYMEYDIKYSDEGRIGTSFGVGVSGGYVWQFSQKIPLFFELGAMVGFEHINYRRYWHYDPTNCDVYDGRRIKNCIFPAGLNASLVWRF